MFYVGIILERHYKEPGILTSQDDSWNVTYWMLWLSFSWGQGNLRSSKLFISLTKKPQNNHQGLSFCSLLKRIWKCDPTCHGCIPHWSCPLILASNGTSKYDHPALPTLTILEAWRRFESCDEKWPFLGRLFLVKVFYPKRWVRKGSCLISGKSRLVKYHTVIWPDFLFNFIFPQINRQYFLLEKMVVGRRSFPAIFRGW